MTAIVALTSILPNDNTYLDKENYYNYNTYSSTWHTQTKSDRVAPDSASFYSSAVQLPIAL